MKTMILSTISILVSLSAACEKSKINWPQAIDCAIPHGTIIESVSSVLLRDGMADKLSKESRQALADLGAQYGYQAVSCALVWAADNLLQVMPVSLDGGDSTALREAAVKRAVSFVQSEAIR